MSNWTHIVRRALAKLRYPSIDASGNMIANVNHRVDTLANLLIVPDAGNGEIAVASDQDAIVVYTGTPGVPVTYTKAAYVAEFSGTSPAWNLSNVAIPNAVITVVQLGTPYPDTFDANNILCDVRVELTVPVSMAGLYLFCEVRHWGNAQAISAVDHISTELRVPLGYAGATTIQFGFTMPKIKLAPVFGGAGKVALALYHEQGASVTFNAIKATVSSHREIV